MTLSVPQMTDALPGECPAPLRRFIWDIQSMVELAEGERALLMIGSDLMARLVASDDWLPDAFATPDAGRHQQFALYADAMERFSVVATILSNGQLLPVILDPLWEIMGVLRGPVSLARFALAKDAAPVQRGSAERMAQGTVATFPADERDALRLGNQRGDGLAIVIHVYGGEMAGLVRHSYLPDGTSHLGPVTYANAVDAPPYDIFSIQARIAD